MAAPKTSSNNASTKSVEARTEKLVNDIEKHTDKIIKMLAELGILPSGDLGDYK